MKKKLLILVTVVGFGIISNAQNVIQVLDSAVSYLNGKHGVKYEYQYDEKGIAISEIYLYWKNSTNTWIKDRKCEYQYDGNQNQTWITFYWNSSSNAWVENKKYEYQYDDNKTLETYYIWDNNIHAWKQISTAQYNYYYSSITVSGIFPINIEQPVTIFPNPATNYITIKSTVESIITVSTISGGIIYKQIMADESKTIDVSSWASGVYLISVETGNNRTVKKIIKN